MRKAYTLPKSARAQMLEEALGRAKYATKKTQDNSLPLFARKEAGRRAKEYLDIARSLAADLIAAGMTTPPHPSVHEAREVE